MLPGKERGLEIRTNKERGKGAGKENPYVKENEGFGTAHGAWRKGHIPWRRGGEYLGLASCYVSKNYIFSTKFVDYQFF